MIDGIAKCAFWLFVAIMALRAITYPLMEWTRYDLHHGEPRTHFYSAEAWADCGAMQSEAARRGTQYWTCHKPPTAQPVPER